MKPLVSLLLVCLLLVCLLFARPLLASNRGNAPVDNYLTIDYVDGKNGSDANSGKAGSPFKTITKALRVATAGNLVIVDPGVHSPSSGEQMPLAGGDGRDGVASEGGSAEGAGLYAPGSVTLIHNTFVENNTWGGWGDDTADFGGDSKADLFWHHYDSGQMAVWTMDGADVVNSLLLPLTLADPNWKVAP